MKKRCSVIVISAMMSMTRMFFKASKHSTTSQVILQFE